MIIVLYICLNWLVGIMRGNDQPEGFPCTCIVLYGLNYSTPKQSQANKYISYLKCCTDIHLRAEFLSTFSTSRILRANMWSNDRMMRINNTAVCNNCSMYVCKIK